MKAQELRIGNYAAKRLKSGIGRTLEAPLGVQDIVRIKENTGSFIYEPIPLTEEWLLRAGFVFAVDGLMILPRFGYFIQLDPNNNYSWEFSTGILHANESFEKEKEPLVYIEYVHQLQNLYFALTGEELTFDLPVNS